MDTDSDTPQRPKANDGGCRLRNAVLPILALAAFSIAVVCVTPLAVAFVDRVDIDTQDRQQVITRAVSQSVQDFFHSMEQMPFHASAFSTLSVTNLRDINATQRLLLALQLQCETCTYVYYGLSDGFFGSMAPTADARYKQFCYPISIPGGHQYCCNTDAQTGVCTAPAADTNEIYNPVVRPWYQQLVQRDQWSSLYPSFAKPTTVSTTVGGPILDVPTNTVIGAFAADVNFATLQASISAMALTTSDSGGYALYEATSLYVIFASFDDRPQRQVVTLADLKNVSLGTNFNDLSDDDLVSNVSVSKTLGAPFFRRYLSVVPLVNITGLDLRIVTVFLEAPISESARYSLGLSAGLGLGLVVAMSITVAVVTVFVVERPLHLLADRMRAGVLVAMGTEDALEDIPPSKPYLKELIEIQESFDVMTYELHRLRAFVPKSFLIDSMEAFEDEGEPEQYNNTLRNVRVDEALLGAAADDDDQQPGSPRRNSQLSSISSSATPARQASPTPPGGSATQRQFVMVGPPSPRGDQGTHDSPAVVGAAAPPPVGQSTVRFTHLLGVVNTKLATKRWLNRSQTSAKTSPNAPAAIGRRFHKDIKQAAVTLATIRLRHVDAVLKCGRDPRFGSDVLALVASVFECAATRHGGVIDHYSGDRVTIAFNAHRPTSGHRRSSIECILTISRLLTELSVPRSGRIDVTLNRQSAEWEQKDASDPLHQQPAASAASSASETVRVRPCWRGVSSGVASGNATVGNVGSDTLTRFAIMSECVDASAALEMRCRQVEFDDGSGLPCVCSGTYAPDIGFSVAYQTIDVIKTNHAGRMETTIAPMRMLLAKPSGSPPQRDDGNDSEWMYELQRAQEANEFNDVNAGFDAFAAGRLNEARAALARAEARSDRVSAQVGIARLRELVLVGAAGEP